MDWNDDGIGDFEGLAHRIDYLHELGVTCLWLMPFYPTPDRDDGYDISDFYGVDPRLGDFGDFVEMIRMAQDRGIRVIVDLVVNHTSDQHPWFRGARSSRDSPVPRLLRLARRAAGKKPSSRSSPTRRTASGSSTRRRASTTCTTSTGSSPTSTSPTPRCATRSPRSWGSGCSSGSAGFRVDAVPFLLDDERASSDAEDCARPTRSTSSSRCGRSSVAGRATPCMLGEANLPRDRAVRLLRRRRRRRPHDAVRLHHACRTSTSSLAREDAAAAASSAGVATGDSRSSRSGRTSCATTTS